MKEGVIDPVRKFMSGPQKGIFDNARKFVQTQEPNFDYLKEGAGIRYQGAGNRVQVSGDSVQEAAKIADISAPCPLTPDTLIHALTDPECFKGNRMQQVKTQVETLQEKVTTRIAAEIAKARETVAALKGRLCIMAEFGVLNGEQQEQIIRPFNEFAETIERQKLIAVIRDSLRRFEEEGYHRILERVYKTTEHTENTEKSQDGSRNKPTTTTKHESKQPSVSSVYSVVKNIPFSGAWLADESDVDRYLESMREALLEEIRKGKRIQI